MDKIFLNTDSAFTPQGNLFKKHLLRFGRWTHPLDSDEFWNFTSEVADKMIYNFNQKVAGSNIPVLNGHHDSLPTESVGKVVGLVKESDGLYGIVEFGDEKANESASKGLIPGISVAFAWNFRDAKEGKEHGPTLLHAALVNDPHIKNLRDFEQLNFKGTQYGVMHLERQTMTKEEMIKKLKEEHKIDVTSLESAQGKLTTAEKDKEASNKKVTELEASNKEQKEKLDTIAAKSGSSKEVIALQQKVHEAEKKSVTLEAESATAKEAVAASDTRIKKLEEENANREADVKVSALINAGKVKPADKAAYIGLAKGSPTIFAQISPTLGVVVPINKETGVVTGGGPLTSVLQGAELESTINGIAKRQGLVK